MKRLALMLTCFFISMGLAIAQNRQVTGVVVDESGEPVIGASVVVKGTTTGTVTDLDGKFSLSVPENAKSLIVKYLGMQEQVVAVEAQVSITLHSSATDLDEVIVVAYGTTKRAEFVGSAAKVSGEKLTARSTSNITNALQGAAAGVLVVNGSGQPGTGAKIRIRGVGSINGGIDPLYVVDGAPYSSDVLNLIDPHDIESMTVLKDAAATAIYGARGANGVVLITTKKGSFEGVTVNVDAKWGNSSRAVPNYNVMTDPAMYYETLYKALYNSRIYNGNSAANAFAYADANIFSQTGAGYQVYTIPNGERFIGTNFKLNPHATLGYKQGEYYYTPDNWEKETLKTNNLRQEYNVQVNGGNKQTSYFLSGGFLKDPGLINGSGFERYTLRGNVDAKAKEWLKVGANFLYGHSKYQNPGYQATWGSTANVFANANLMAPIYPFYVRNADGSIMKDSNGWTVYDSGNATNFLRPGSAPRGNHAINLLLDENYDYTDYINTNFYATLIPIKELQITARITPTVANNRSMSLSNPFYGSPTVGGSVVVEHNRVMAINQQYIADYKKTYDSMHNIEVLAGYEDYTLTIQKLKAGNDHLYSPFVGELNNAFGTQPTSANANSSSEHYATAGFLGRLQYDYDTKYFFNATIRHEASSRFAPNKRWGTFGSVGAAWLISKENFMASTTDWLNELKFKISYGTQGNDQVENYHAYRDSYQISYNSDTGEYTKVLFEKGNPDLKWEAQKLFNTGFEFAFFDKKLWGGIEYFSRTNSDMLFNVPMPPSVGYESEPQNIGSVRNNGVEIELNADIVRTNNLKWSANANITFINSKILKLPEYTEATGGLKYSSYIYKEGGSLNQAYMQQYAGVDPNTGQALYYLDPDNGDYSTTANYSEAKPADLGDVSIDAYGGFGTTVEAYGFDLTVQFAYQLGGKAYDGTYQELMHSGKQSGRNWHLDILKAWTPENPNRDIPRIDSADDHDQNTSGRWLTSTSYLSLNALNFGYTLPKKLTQKFQISKMRFYVAGDNLWLLSARKGFDPRQTQNAFRSGVGLSTNSGNFVYSQMRVISGGISLTF